MKKVILFLCLTVAGFVTQAQSAFTYTASNPTGSFTNAAADTMYYTTSTAYGIVTVQPVFTKTSGTMAGTATLAYSVNGTNWVASGSTLTLTDVTTNSTVWNVTSAARYWRIIRNGATTVTGTSAAKISAHY